MPKMCKCLKTALILSINILVQNTRLATTDCGVGVGGNSSRFCLPLISHTEKSFSTGFILQHKMFTLWYVGSIPTQGLLLQTTLTYLNNFITCITYKNNKYSSLNLATSNVHKLHNEIYWVFVYFLSKLFSAFLNCWISCVKTNSMLV